MYIYIGFRVQGRFDMNGDYIVAIFLFFLQTASKLRCCVVSASGLATASSNLNRQNEAIDYFIRQRVTYLFWLCRDYIGMMEKKMDTTIV